MSDDMRAIFVAGAATGIAFSAADVLVMAFAVDYSKWRNPSTEFAFRLPSQNYPILVLCVIFGAIAVHTKKWLVPLIFGWFADVIVMSLFYRPLHWSGPGELLQVITPLYDFRCEVTDYVPLLNAALVIAWVCRQKSVGRKMASIES